MALPQEALDIDAQRVEIVAQIETLKAKARELKKQYDKVVNRAKLEHKLAGMSEAEKAELKDLLG